MDREAEATMARWRACCEALDRAQSLVSVDLWLDTTEPVWRGLLSFVPGDNANPFVFPEKLAAKLTVDLPVNPDRPEVWKDVAAIEPAFSIRARGWPAFRAEIPDTPATTTTPPHSIIKLWESAEPGALRTPLIFGTHHAHPIRR